MASDLRLTRPRLNWAYVVLALVLLLTGLSTWFVNSLAQKQRRIEFQREVDTLQIGMDQRLRSYLDVMRSARAVWTVTPEVTRDEFSRYVDSIELERSYPGIQ